MLDSNLRKKPDFTLFLAHVFCALVDIISLDVLRVDVKRPAVSVTEFPHVFAIALGQVCCSINPAKV